jgi:hypothetical protein
MQVKCSVRATRSNDVHKKLFVVFVAIGILLSACTLPGTTGVEPDLMTAAALTVDAALVSTPLTSPTTAALPGESPVPGPQSTATGTATSGAPMLGVGQVTDCRTGPGDGYERVMELSPGQQFSIAGHYPPNYWLVNTQQGSCWVFREFATPVGSYLSVPRITPPPTPIAEIPAAPSFREQGWSFFCYAPGKMDITLNWNDRATNETGYRILRDGEEAAELPADSTFFAETIDLTAGESVTYEVQAYNATGTANSKPAVMACP